MLTVIDGSGLVVRAQRAMARSGLTDGQGRDTGTLVGFLGELAKATDLAKPSAVVVAWDSIDPTLYRHRLSSAYKPQRSGCSIDDLCVELCARLGMTQYVEDGFEADDIIAAYWRTCDGPMRIVSDDKDMYQLLDERRDVAIIRHDGEMFTEDDFVSKHHCLPCQWADVLAYAGDKADGVIGMAGIGYVTAAQHIGAEGSLGAVVDKLTAEGIQSQSLDLKRVLANLKLVDLRSELFSAFGKMALPVPQPWDPPLEDVAEWLDTLDAHAMAFRVTKKWGWGLLTDAT